MVTTSAAFTEAIRNGEPQIPLFLFDNAVMTSDDIDSNSGIQFSENVMSGEDFAPGSCCSSTLDFTIINDDGEWSEFQYGEFTALLGVRTYHQKEISDSYCRISMNGNTICGNKYAPYLTLNGNAVSGADEAVKALLLLRDKLFAFTDSGYVGFTYDGSSLSKEDFTFYDAPIIGSSKNWMISGIGFAYGHKIDGVTTGLNEDNCFTIFGQSDVSSYEMIPLGVFNAEKPVYSSRKNISVESFDRIVKFDKDYKSSDFTFPTSVYGLLQRVCGAAGAPLKNSSIDNGEITIASEPDFSGHTLRDIIGYIAEISGDFVRVSRDGKLELKWFSDAGVKLEPNDYSESDVGYFNTAGVDKIVIRDIGADDVSYGSGENILYIQNNPIAKILVSGGG